jgi:thiol:disulfide interchange protein DsbC
MMPKTKPIVAALLLASTSLAFAADPDEIALLERLKRMYPATQWTAVTRTPMAGVYEAVMGSNLAYVGSDGRHFLFGHLFDMRTQTDLTAPKLATAERISRDPSEALPKISFAALPLNDAIKVVHGNGSRVLAVFSDPNCPYCKVLDGELAKVDNVTLYTFLLPWISPDRTAAETAWARAVPERAHDTALLDRNVRLATQVGLRGTPLLIAGDGRLSEGAKPAAELEAWLNAGESPDRTANPSPTAEKTP